MKKSIQTIEASIQLINGRCLTQSEFSYLYKQHYYEFKNYLSRDLEQEDVEDCINDVFIKLVNDSVLFSCNTGNVLNYVWRSLKNKKIDYLRKKSVSRMLSIERDCLIVNKNYINIKNSEDVEIQLDHIKKIKDIRKYVASLPRTNQKIILMKFWWGYTIREIYAFLNEQVPTGTISTVLYRFQHNIRKKYKQ